MFQSPIGGISFIANLIIIFVGNILKLFKNDPVSKRYIVTQDNISHLESSRYGAFVSLFLAYAMPVLIAVFVLLLCSNALYRLYQDKDKITILDIAESGYRVGRSEVLGIIPKHDALNTSDAVVHEVVATMTSRVLGGDTPQLSDIDNVGLKEDQGTSDDSIPDEYVLMKGRELNLLVPFMEANGLDSSFKSREEFAKYFGAEQYLGTPKQNRVLLDQLKSLKLSQINEGYNINSETNI